MGPSLLALFFCLLVFLAARLKGGPCYMRSSLNTFSPLVKNNDKPQYLQLCHLKKYKTLIKYMGVVCMMAESLGI